MLTTSLDQARKCPRTTRTGRRFSAQSLAQFDRAALRYAGRPLLHEQLSGSGAVSFACFLGTKHAGRGA